MAVCVSLLCMAVGWLGLTELRGYLLTIGAVLLAIVAGFGLLLLSLGAKRGPAAAGGVAVALALLFAVVQVTESGDDSPDEERSPNCTTLTTAVVDVDQRQDAERLGLSFPSVTYELGGAGDQMYIRFAGDIAGDIPPGNTLHLARRSDPDSLDSTPERNPGNGNYYLRREPMNAGCWATDEVKLSYAGARGLDFQYLFVLVPEASAPLLDELERRDPPNGLEDFEDLEGRVVASFEIET